MGLVSFIQWPLTFYQGGLIGLQKMISLNTVGVIFNTLRAAGAIILLGSFSPTVIVFFLWQAVISIFQVAVTALLLWRSLPPSDHAPTFRIKLLTDTWRFTAGMTAASFVAFFLEQADKVILSKFLSLEFFGYYSLAATLNSQFQLIGAQILRPLFPRFAAQIAGNAMADLRNLYYKSCQFISVAILPIAAIVAFFSHQLIYIWTQDPTTAAMTAPITALLFIGTALYNLLDVPYALSIAYGWTRLIFFQQLFSVLVLTPLMVILSIRFGGVGAALTKVILSLLYLVFIPPIVYRKLPVLQGGLRRLYVIDTGIPLLAVLIVAGIGYMLTPLALPTFQFIVVVVLITLITFVAAVLSAGEIRNWIFERIVVLYRERYSA
jgi:O-antigen/teichoic acid export membrane protein